MLRALLRSFGLQKASSEPLAQPEGHAHFAPLEPAEPLAIIGDVHGMQGPFERMLATLDSQEPQARIVCVGDLIDRGEHSAEVLRLAFARREKMVVLMGNHEEMLLSFLDNPVTEAGRWLRNGGLQTLASFGIAPAGLTAGEAEHRAVRDRLRAALGPEIEAWLGGLPRFVQSGNVLVTHAGADPWQPVSLQSDRALTWGHPDFGRRRRTDGLWVAHGHVIVATGSAERGIISVDTGAYAGGTLTTALVSRNLASFLS